MGSDANKKVVWIGSSRDALSSFPDEVRSELGYALYVAQAGGVHRSAKPMRGDLSGVVEVVCDSDNGDTYRAMYTVKLEDFLYVLHCFQKKSKKGIATPQSEIKLIRKRLKVARDHNAEHIKNKEEGRRARDAGKRHGR